MVINRSIINIQVNDFSICVSFFYTFDFQIDQTQEKTKVKSDKTYQFYSL